MSAFASSDKPVAAAAAGAFALAVAYFSWSSAKKSAESSRASTVPAAGVPSTPSDLRNKAQTHVDPTSTSATTAATNNAVILTASEDDYSYSPSMLDNTAQTVTSFIAPDPFPDADVAAFFASFSAALPSGKQLAEGEEEEGDKKKKIDAEDRGGIVAGSTRFDTAGRSSAEVMAQCGALIASDAAFDGLKADAATDVVERAANLYAYVEWKQQQQQAASSLSPTDVATVPPATTDPTTVGTGASADEKEKDAATAKEQEEGVATMMAVPSEQLAALSALIDARVDTIEKWREHEAPIIRSIVRMLREIREELANIDHYKVDPEQAAAKKKEEEAVGASNDDALQPAPLGEVVTKSGDELRKAGAGQEKEEEGEEEGGPVVQRRDSIHPELVAKTAADIRERIRRLRGIVERLHTPLRELGPIGDLCNQLEAIASVLAGTE